MGILFLRNLKSQKAYEDTRNIFRDCSRAKCKSEAKKNFNVLKGICKAAGRFSKTARVGCAAVAIVSGYFTAEDARKQIASAKKKIDCLCVHKHFKSWNGGLRPRGYQSLENCEGNVGWGCFSKGFIPTNKRTKGFTGYWVTPCGSPKTRIYFFKDADGGCHVYQSKADERAADPRVCLTPDEIWRG